MHVSETWYFTSGGTSGNAWTERYYAEASSMAVAANFNPSFVEKRLNLLDPLNIWKKVRITDLANPRSSLIVTINQNGRSNGGGPATVAEAAVCQLSSTIFPCSRRLWLRGFSDADVTRDPLTGVDKLADEFRANLTTFIQGLANNNYEILTLKRLDPAGMYPARITRADGSAANGQTKLTVTANPGLIVGKVIIISRASKKDTPALNGMFKVLAADATSITIPYTTPLDGIIDLATCQYRLREYNLGAYINASISGFQYLSSRQSRGYFNNVRGAARANRGLRSSR